MNFVDFMLDCYSHITSHVSQVFASCTHNTSYSLLNIIHVIVCVFGLTNQVWKIIWVLCKTDLLLKKKKEDCLKSKFWENWVLNLEFVKKSFHLILMHFFNSSMLWGEVASNSVDFPKFIFFYNFDRSSLFFNQSKLHLKISVSLCLVRLIKPVFSINRTSWIKFFFLNTVFDSFKTLFQNFFKLSSLSPTWQGSTENFLSFSTKFFARFFSSKADKTFIPLLLLLFSWFHA